MRSNIKSASVDVLGEAFSHMNRLKLCTLQRVCRSFRDAVNTHFHSRPTYSPRGQRFHIVATTEDTDTLIYSDLQYVCASVFNVDDLLCHPMSRGGREYVFPHLSLAGIRDGNTAALVPEFLTISYFTLVYGKLVSARQLALLGNLGKQWPPYDNSYELLEGGSRDHEWGIFPIKYSRPTRFTLQYCRHHDHIGDNRVELSGDALEYILSHLPMPTL